MTANKNSLRILIADDNDLVRSDLCSLLQEQRGWCICGEAANGTDAINEAIRLKPDVIVIDVSMPDMNGFEVASRIHERLPDAEILIVTAHDSRAFAHIGPKVGVRGYVMKSRARIDLVPAVEAASKHEPFSKVAVTGLP